MWRLFIIIIVVLVIAVPVGVGVLFFGGESVGCEVDTWLVDAGVFDEAGELYEFLPFLADDDAELIIDASPDGTGGTLDRPTRMTVTADGTAYVAGRDSDNVFEITADGEIAQIIGSADGLDEPRDLTVDDEGNVYVTGWLSTNLYRIAPGGEPDEIIPTDAGLIDPRGVAVTPGGTVFVGDRFNVYELAADGGFERFFEFASTRGVESDEAGNVYVVDELNDQAFRIPPGGEPEVIIGRDDGLDSPRDVAVAPDGTVYVSGHDTQNVFRIADGRVEELANADDGLENPVDLAVDDAGNVYLPVGARDRLLRISANGNVTTVLDADGATCSPLRKPSGVAVDGDGNVYVTGEDSDNAFRVNQG